MTAFPRVLLALVMLLLVPASASAPAPRWHEAWVSTYTWDSNSPPGCGIEYARDYGYPTVHDCAGGTGTYADPVTFASQLNEWAPGTRVYIPWFRDYFIKEDWCASCYSLPHAWQLDVWVGQASPGSHVANFWRRLRVEVNPPPGLPVVAKPLMYR